MKVRLAEIREAKGLILDDIAEKVGVAISTVQRWEKQSISIPSERLPAICAAYGCRIIDIFDDGCERDPEASCGSEGRLPTAVEIERLLYLASRDDPQDLSIASDREELSELLATALKFYAGREPPFETLREFEAAIDGLLFRPSPQASLPS